MGKGKAKKGRGAPTMAELADRHVLYQKSVQDPAAEIEFLDEKFSRLRGRRPMRLREDFCGTALLATAWARSHPRRTAVAVDLDRETLEWGRRHNVEAGGPELARRVELIEADVLEVETAPVDVLCAFNFSYYIFQERERLLAYLRRARGALAPGGILVMDCYGGTESGTTGEEEREVDGFAYVWEQAEFNPISHRGTCYIHFRFPDGSELPRAFSYHWRMWSLPELRELLDEAGFAAVHVYWEEFEEGEPGDEYLVGTGRYREVVEVENQESWIAYLIAEA